MRVLRRDGAAIGRRAPSRRGHPAPAPASKVTVIASDARRPSHRRLVDAPARGPARAGATALRGVWGFHGDHAPHGDGLLRSAAGCRS